MRTALLGLAVCGAMVCGSAAVHAQALVIDGQEVADAALMANAKKDGKVVYYGTWPPNAAAAVQAAFKKATGIEVEYLRLTTQALYPRVTAEFAANKLQADLIDMTDLILVQDLVDKGILNTPHKTPSFERLPEDLRDPQGRWYAVYRPPSAITVNKALLPEKDMPKTFKDVLNPKLAGSIGMPTIDAGGSSFALFMFLRDAVQPDYWTKLATQKPRVYPSIITAVGDVARGETLAVIGGIDPSFQQIESGAPLEIVFGTEGIPSFPIGAGVATNAPHAAAAKVFLNWLTSKEGSAAVAKAGSYGIHPDAPPAQALGKSLPPNAQVWNIKLADWMSKRDSYSKQWRDLFSGGK